jgi:hypothetical protein
VGHGGIGRRAFELSRSNAMTDEIFTRPPVTLRVFGPGETDAPIVIDVPEPYPAERPEPANDNIEEEN